MGDDDVMQTYGKARVKEWLKNLQSPWKEIYQDIKSRDPKGAAGGPDALDPRPPVRYDARRPRP
jgi:hypothetical protein